MTNDATKLLAVGYWRTSSKSLFDMPERLPEPINLQASNRKFDGELGLVLSYLSNGSEFVHWRGYSFCRICGDSSKIMGSKCLTDGVWVWPEGLAHYIDCHHVDMPAEFIANMMEHNWNAPEVDIDPGRDVDSWYDFSFWINGRKTRQRIEGRYQRLSFSCSKQDTTLRG